MDAPSVVVIGFVAIVVLDLAALRFGCDSRRWVREMPGASDGSGLRRSPLPRAPDRGRRRLVWPTPVPNPAVYFTGRDWATAPPLRGLLRLRPPVSATGYARLDLAALGK